MSTWTEALIGVYAATPVADIGADAGYGRLHAAHGGDPRFQLERQQLETAKQHLEVLLDAPQTTRDQVRHALEEMASLKGDSARQEVTLALIRAGYRPRWSAPQQRYFDESVRKLNWPYDFFLSFTTRRPGKQSANPINTNYKYLIQSVLGVKRYKHANIEKENLLAEAVWLLLSESGYNGFFFPHGANSSTDVWQKLEAACRESLVFIQLIQNQMFVNLPGVTNYCHREWKEAKSAVKGDPAAALRVAYAVTENGYGMLVGPPVFQDFQDWHAEISGASPPYLQYVANYNAGAIELVKKAIRNDIRTLIGKARQAIYAGIPA